MYYKSSNAVVNAALKKKNDLFTKKSEELDLT